MKKKSLYIKFKVELKEGDINSITDLFLYLDSKDIRYKIEEEHIFYIFSPDLTNKPTGEINGILQKINKVTGEKRYKRSKTPLNLDPEIFKKINRERYYRINKKYLAKSVRECFKGEKFVRLDRLPEEFKSVFSSRIIGDIDKRDWIVGEIDKALRFGVFYRFPEIERKVSKQIDIKY